MLLGINSNYKAIEIAWLPMLLLIHITKLVFYVIYKFCRTHFNFGVPRMPSFYTLPLEKTTTNADKMGGASYIIGERARHYQRGNTIENQGYLFIMSFLYFDLACLC